MAAEHWHLNEDHGATMGGHEIGMMVGVTILVLAGTMLGAIQYSRAGPPEDRRSRLKIAIARLGTGAVVFLVLMWGVCFWFAS
jgi:hypothetical protein